MSKQQGRELTMLEYVVLGLISIEPQSGYSISNFFTPEGVYSWSGSPGSIYPILKRLEQADIIRGELEMEHESRPRKMYTLSAQGGEMLDEWLRQVPKVLPLYEQREIGLWRFQFMEKRLNKTAIIRWLDEYLDNIRIYDAGRKFAIHETLAQMTATGQTSVHQQLIMEGELMELSALRTWLEMARTRITTIAYQTGEFPVVGET